jgi:hypothetical protein
VTADESSVLQPAASFEWVRVIDGVDFTTAEAVAKLGPKHRPAERTIAGISYRLALWADPDGSNVKPSLDRVAVICRVDFKTAQTVMAILREIGLLELLRHGGRGQASLHRLTVPVDLLERVQHRSPDDIRALMAGLRARRWKPISGGMPTTDRDRLPGVDNVEPVGGCPPLIGADGDRISGGMPTSNAGSVGGCPPDQWGDAHHIPTSDRPEETHQPTSPQSGTSPGRPAADAKPDISLDPETERGRQLADLAARFPGFEIPAATTAT